MNADASLEAAGTPGRTRYRPDTAAALAALSSAESFADGGAAPWAQDLRREAMDRVRHRGLPVPSLERWGYTNLPAFVGGMDLSFGAAAMTADVRGAEIHDLAGALAGETPFRGVIAAAPEGDGAYGDMMLWDLCNAFARDGLVIDVPPGEKAAGEIRVAGRDGLFSTPRLIVRLGAGASLKLTEIHEGRGRYWINGLAQVLVGRDAKLDHCLVQRHAPDAAFTRTAHVRVLGGGACGTFALTAGSGLSRNQVQIDLAEPGASCVAGGATLLRGTQHGDTTVLVEHRAPRCSSRQTFRAVLDGRARGVYQGKIHVHEGAQKTDGYQLSGALLLSEGAEMDTKPELEIYADDVKCSHGATAGRLDEESLFYLRSRGIGEGEARALLIEAFLAGTAEMIGCGQAKEIVLEEVRRWLGTGSR